MGLNLLSEHLNGLMLFEPKIFTDVRGFFMESFRLDQLRECGIEYNFVQDNHSQSKKNVIRGMHFQYREPQGKLIRVTRGAAKVCEIDIRHNSPTLGEYFSVELNEENQLILWVPPGFANGFLSLADNTEMQYKCTAYWNGRGENAIRFNDPAVGIDWNCLHPVVSEKDMNALTLDEWLKHEESILFKI